MIILGWLLVILGQITLDSLLAGHRLAFDIPFVCLLASLVYGDANLAFVWLAAAGVITLLAGLSIWYLVALIGLTIAIALFHARFLSRQSGLIVLAVVIVLSIVGQLVLAAVSNDGLTPIVVLNSSLAAIAAAVAIGAVRSYASRQRWTI